MATKGLFDHLNAIFTNQSPTYFDTLDDASKKTYNCFMINRGISMNSSYLPIVNELNLYWGQIGSRESYLFYSQSLPKAKQFNKWIKSTATEEHESWLMELIQRHYECSSYNAHVYLTLFYKTETSRIVLRTILEGYGVESKRLKKLGLL